MNDALRIPGVPDRWQQYGLCILFHLLLPFLPLCIEKVVLGHVDAKTLLLFTAVFPLSIGVSSRNRLMFGVTIVIGLVYSIFFGLISGSVHLDAAVFSGAYVFLLTVMLIHALERYNRHVVELEPFWGFA